MISVEHIDVYGFEHAVRGMRNPMNSWDKSDSYHEPANYCDSAFIVGEDDLDLMRRLYKGGTEHRKYLRQISVWMDITAPTYWIAEFDTYKVGVSRNSCSFMHKGVSRPFTINDFSVSDNRIYRVLNPLPTRWNTLKYPYETEEYKLYSPGGNRLYRVYKNGRIFSEPFEYEDTMGRKRSFPLRECKPSATPSGYYEVNIGGDRFGEKWMVHRLVAHVWIDNPDNLETVDHIDSDKGNNSVENLQWSSLKDNIQKGFEDGNYERVKDIHCRYRKWKNGHTVLDPLDKIHLLNDRKEGMSYSEITEKYNVTPRQAANLINQKSCDEQDLFVSCALWEKIIDQLNALREEYLRTQDEKYFQMIRCLLPSGYNQRFTICMNYENVVTMIKQRENHRLPEWQTFVEILKTLPYVRDIMGEEEA